MKKITLLLAFFCFFQLKAQFLKTTLTASLLSPPEKDIGNIERIAILNFENISSEEFKEAGIDVGSKMADYLSIELLKEQRGKSGNCFIEGGRTNIYTIVEREEIQRVLDSKNIELSNLNDEQLLLIGKELNVDAIVAGNLSYSSTDERDLSEYVTKKGVLIRTYTLKRTTSTEVRMKVISMVNGEIIGQTSSRFSHYDTASSNKTKPTISSVKSSSKLAELSCERIANSFANYLAPYYYNYTFTFERVKNKKLKQRVKDATRYLKLKEIDKAYQMYDAIYNVDAYNAELVFNMGILNEVVGNYEKAKEFYNTAVNMNSEKAVYVNGLNRTEKNIDLTKYLNDIGIEIKPYTFQASSKENLLIEKIQIKGSKRKRKVAYQDANESSQVLGEFPGGFKMDLLKVSEDEKWLLVNNNIFSDAATIKLGETNNAKIGTFSDQDFYKLEITKPGVLIADIYNIPTNIGIRYTLYDSRQNEINTWDNRNSGGKPLYANDLVCEVGTYFFRINHYYNNAYNSGLYTFKISLDTEDNYECNNIFSNAGVVNLDEINSAKIGTSGDVDFYKVEITEPGVFIADIYNIPSNIGIRYVLYDSKQNEINSWDNRNSGGRPLKVARLLCNSGTYFFRINHYYNNASNLNPYTFKVSLDTSDAYECNNSFTTATPIELCETISGAIYDTGDQDYYSFDATAGQQINIQLTNIASNIRPDITLYNSSQSQIVSRTGNTGANLNYSFVPSSTEKHYIKIEEWGNNASNSQLYELLLESNCSLSTNDILNENSFMVYPNPAKEKLTIQLEERLSLQKINIYNPLGQLFTTVKSKTLDISKLAKGVYNIEIITNKGKGVKQFIKD